MTAVQVKTKLVGKNYKWAYIHVFFLAYLSTVNAFDAFPTAHILQKLFE